MKQKKAPINDFCQFEQVLFPLLVDTYQMKNWKMSWEEFFDQAKKETKYLFKQWKKEVCRIDRELKEENN